MSAAKPGPGRPGPEMTKANAPFWEGARNGKLMLQFDPASGAYQFWPRSIGLKSGRRDLEWREASGEGTLYSYTVTHIPMPGFGDDGPYPLGLVELDEGVRMIGQLRNVATEDLRIGLRVRAQFETFNEGDVFVVFEPV